MERYVTQPQTLRFTNFSLAILFCLLTFNGTLAKSQSIISDVAINVKLTSATLGATITPPESIILDRGFVWGTASGVTTANHVVSEGGISGGWFAVDVTGLDRSKTIYYKSYYEQADGTFILSAESSFSNVPVFSGTGNWTDDDNWSIDEIPGLISGDSVIIDGVCNVVDLTINSGAKLTINAGKVLNVTGTLNNTNVAGLIIKSDGITPNATLTYMNGSPVATVEMYSKANWDLYQAEGSKYSWQFFGIPVKTFSLNNNNFKNCLIRKYYESSKDEMGLWVNQSKDSTLTSGTGYEISQSEPITYKFTGELTNEDFMKTLDFTIDANYPGQHLFTNPYTAAIDINKIKFINAEKAVYLYNTGTYIQWVMEGENTNTGSAPGQYSVSTPNTEGIFGVPDQIPSMQGFLVKTLDQTEGSIKIPYLGSLENNTDQQRIKGVINDVPLDKVVTRIDLSGSHFADRMWIFSDPTCTAKFDNGWDGYKIQGSVLTPQLYAMEEDGDFQIDAIADINGTYLGFNAGSETNYKLNFTHLNAEKLYNGLYLIDLLENKTIDITTSGSEYEFTALSTPTAVKRFKIVTSTEVSTGTPSANYNVKVFNSNGILFVQNNSDQTGNLTLYNMNGVPVKRIEYKANEITTISTLNLLPGAYIAKACTSKDMVTEKIIIR